MVRSCVEDFPCEVTNRHCWQYVSLDLEKHWSWGNFPMDEYRYYTDYDLMGNDLHVTDAYRYDPAKQFVFAFPNRAKFSGAVVSVKDFRVLSEDGDVLYEDGGEGWIGNITGRKGREVSFKISNDDKKAHFGKVGAFSAKQVFHIGFAFGRFVSKRVNSFNFRHNVIVF